VDLSCRCEKSPSVKSNANTLYVLYPGIRRRQCPKLQMLEKEKNGYKGKRP
jgi:hypothetical protein